MFGLDTGDSINLVIAATAVLGFIASIIISIISLRQTKKLIKWQNNATLFNERYDIISKFDKFFANYQWKEKTESNALFMKDLAESIMKANILFNDATPLFDLITTMVSYYTKKDAQLPTYRNVYSKFKRHKYFEKYKYFLSYGLYTSDDLSFLAHVFSVLNNYKREMGIN